MDYTLDLNVQDIVETSDGVGAEVILNSTYHIPGNNDTLENNAIKYDLLLEKHNGKYMIKSVETDDDDYAIFKERISENSKKTRSRVTALDSIFDETNQIAETIKNMPVKELITQDTTDSIATYATSVSYSSSLGTLYANKYYINNAPFFYKTGSDCTNFVSQCVWAAYGGWRYQQSTDTISSDIRNKRRMTGTWYGGSGGGSSAWESVEGLWSYVTSNTSNGPRATGYNNGKNYTGVSAGSIGVGNVLQMRGGTSGNYTHSVYVYNCTAPITYSSITVMQHTSNKKRAVQDIINVYGPSLCMRRLAFKTTTFAN